MAEGLDLPADPDDAGWAHLLVEAARQAGHDRLAVLHEGADGSALLDPVTGSTARRAAIDPDRAARPWARPRATGAGDTIHLAVVDGDRHGRVADPVERRRMGRHLVVPGGAACSSTTGASASRLEPGHPAEYGPGRRPPRTLAPRPAHRSRRVARTPCSGTMGGDSQPQILLQLLARLLRRRPVARPGGGRRPVRPRRPGGSFATWADRGGVRVEVEGQAPPGWAEGLAARGHAVERCAAPPPTVSATPTSSRWRTTTWPAPAIPAPAPGGGRVLTPGIGPVPDRQRAS